MTESVPRPAGHIADDVRQLVVVLHDILEPDAVALRGGVWWVRARLATVIDTRGLSLAAVADQISSGGIDFDIEQAAGTGDFLH